MDDEERTELVRSGLFALVRNPFFTALLTTTMPSLEETVKAIKASGLTGFKVIVGGAPITKEFADEIGADGYAQDAGSAAVLAKEIIK